MKTVTLLVLMMLLAALIQAQSAKKKQPVVVKTEHLSSYMRDVGLLYVETVEKAVDIWVDPRRTSDNYFDKIWAERSDEQFHLLEMLEDRIEVHKDWASMSTFDALADPDRQFYDFGPQTLKSMAQARAGTHKFFNTRVQYVIALRNAGMRAEADAADEKRKACQQAVVDEITPYVRCDSQVRRTIKDGEWDRDRTREYCDLAAMTQAQKNCN